MDGTISMLCPGSASESGLRGLGLGLELSWMAPPVALVSVRVR